MNLSFNMAVVHSFSRFSLTGVEFGARMVNIDGKQIKLQIWDTVRGNKNTLVLMQGQRAMMVGLMVEIRVVEE